MSQCLRKVDVLKKLRTSKSTLDRWIKRQEFISSAQFGDNSVRFLESEVNEYIERVFAGENRKTVTLDIENKRQSSTCN